jgi:2-(1,2-epoxy-1,2-dihydrophenyl)acetyl-CoA isomerase
MIPTVMAPVLVEQRGPVRWVVLNRPEVHNAIDIPTAEAWTAALGAAATDEAVRAVVIAGRGNSFSSGGDLKAFRQAEDRREYLSTIARVIGEGVWAMVTMPKPVVAAVRGNAMGVGFSMFLASDYKLVAEGTRMAMSYIHVGLTPGGGGTWILQRLVGQSRAMELVLMGEAINAERALEIGIANRVVASSGLRNAAQSVALKLAESPKRAIARTKALVWSGYVESFREHLEREADEIGQAAATHEFDEGSLAFFERRKANF